MRRLLLIVAILALAGCNLDTATSVTLAPSPTSPTPLATPIPAQTVVEPPAAENVFQAIINGLVVPVVNFLFTFVSDAVVSLWTLAWERGGSFGQVLCCIAPGIVVGLLLFARLRLWRKR